MYGMRPLAEYMTSDMLVAGEAQPRIGNNTKAAKGSPIMPAPHSDFLVHWTGSDIERTKDCEKKADKYVKRLRDILLHGLWMSEHPFEWPGRAALSIDSTPSVCFTELKLSESEAHAKKYGRLGIGFKRPFVFNRGGRPMIYWGFDQRAPRDIFLDDFIEEFKKNPERHWRMHFFKPMNSEKDPSSKEPRLNYDNYSESEWRIVLHKRLIDARIVKNPHNPTEREEDRSLAKYWRSLSSKQQEKLMYLVPLDEWLAIIVYPSIMVKNKAQSDSDIRDLIRRLAKPDGVEKGNLPIELPFDSCEHL